MQAKVKCLSAFAAAALLAASTHAGTTRISAVVQVNDLDLSTPEGAEALQQRLQKAVRNLCANYERVDGMGERPFRRCTRAAQIRPSVEQILAQARNTSKDRIHSPVAMK